MKLRRPEPEPPWASFADVLSGMLFVFIITSFIFAWQLREAQAQLERDQADLQHSADRDKARQDAERDAKALVSDKPTEDGDSITTCLTGDKHDGNALVATPDVDQARISLYLHGEVWFKRESSALEDKQRNAVRRIAACIQALITDELAVPISEKYHPKVFLEGHTDATPFSGVKSNWELSAERAVAVLRAVLDMSEAVEGAMHAATLELTAVGMADLHPAWRHICQEAREGNEEACESLVDDEEDALMDEKFLRFLHTGRQNMNIDNLSFEERLRIWANHTDPSRRNEGKKRRKYLRRVDLRIELEPKEIADE